MIDAATASQDALCGSSGSPLSCDSFVVAASIQKDAFTALVKCITSAFLCHAPEQKLHALNLLRQGIQLGQFALGELLPSLGNWYASAEAEKQPLYFIQGEPHLPRALHKSQPVQHAVVIAPLPANTLWFRKNADLFVISNG
jgi:hypothetical protein